MLPEEAQDCERPQPGYDQEIGKSPGVIYRRFRDEKKTRLRNGGKRNDIIAL